VFPPNSLHGAAPGCERGPAPPRPRDNRAALHPTRPRPPAAAAASIATSAPRGGAHPPNVLVSDCLLAIFFIRLAHARHWRLLPRVNHEKVPGPDRDVTSGLSERRDAKGQAQQGREPHSVCAAGAAKAGAMGFPARAMLL
jgi:hypothetical protein